MLCWRRCLGSEVLGKRVEKRCFDGYRLEICCQGGQIVKVQLFFRDRKKPEDVTPKALRVLEYLTRQPEVEVSREMIQAAIWFDDAGKGGDVDHYISELRTVFKGNNSSKRFIETVRRFGFKFLEPVRAEGQPDNGGLSATGPPSLLSQDSVPDRARHDGRVPGMLSPENQDPTIGSFSYGLPAPGLSIGRDAELATAFDRWIGDQQRPLLIWGLPGVGKSNLALALLHHPEVVRRFGARRYWLRCDDRRSATALKNYMGLQWFGLVPRPQNEGSGLDPLIESEIVRRLGQAPAACVIDNFETPHEKDPVGCEKWLRVLLGIDNVWLIVTRHGYEQPAGIRWSKPIEPALLSPEFALELFCRITQNEEHRADSRLLHLLGDLGGLPRAIELLAHQAGQAEDLSPLIARWAENGTPMLERMGGRSRENSLACSYTFVIDSIDDAARQLLRGLSTLPSGVLEMEVPRIAAKVGTTSPLDAAETLARTTLAYRESGRLRLLPPMGDYVRRQDPANPGETAMARQYFLGILETKATSPHFLEELANIQWAVECTLDQSERAGIYAACGLGLMGFFGGIDGDAIVQRAKRVAEDIGDNGSAAYCIWILGEMARYRADYDEARSRFQEGLKFSQAFGNCITEGGCVFGLGTIAFDQSDFNEARRCFEQSLQLFEVIGGNDLRVALCSEKLGEIALFSEDYVEARIYTQKALHINQSGGDHYGASCCLRRLGEIAYHLGEVEQARMNYEAAVEHSQVIGDTIRAAECLWRLNQIAPDTYDVEQLKTKLREALEASQTRGSHRFTVECFIILGGIALGQDDHDEARVCFEKGREISHAIGDRLSVANCFRCLGDIAYRSENFEQALTNHQQGLEIFEAIGHRRGEADALVRLGQTALGQNDHRGARMFFQKALEIYQGIGVDPGSLYCFVSLGDIAKSQSDFNEARTCYQSALEISRARGDDQAVSHCNSRLAELG